MHKQASPADFLRSPFAVIVTNVDGTPVTRTMAGEFSLKCTSAFLLSCLAVALGPNTASATHTCRKLPDICSDPYEARANPAQCARRDPVHEIDRRDHRFDEKACLWFKDSLEVVNGKAAPPGAYGATVLITAPTSQHPCSGILVAPRIVLTARHCRSRGIATREARVIFGNRDNGNSAMARSVVAEPTALRNQGFPDLVLLQLAADAPVAPAVIAQPEWIRSAVAVRVVGFGEDDSGSSGRKLYGDLIAFSNSCNGFVDRRSDSQVYECTPGRELVAAGIPSPGGAVPTDTCYGDSGGPIFVVHPAEGGSSKTFDDAIKAGRYYLAGVTRRGAPGAGLKCGGGGVYTLVLDETLAWIQRTARGWGQNVEIAE
jgi:hypothetical protein